MFQLTVPHYKADVTLMLIKARECTYSVPNIIELLMGADNQDVTFEFDDFDDFNRTHQLLRTL